MTVKIEQSGGRGRFSVDNTEAFNADTAGNIEVAGSLNANDLKVNSQSVSGVAQPDGSILFKDKNGSTQIEVDAIGNIISKAQGDFKISNSLNGNIATGRNNTLGSVDTLANTAVYGNAAAINLATGRDNIAIGNASLQTATNATGCTAVGVLALSDFESGFGNTAIGSRSLDDLTTGTNTTAVGNQAGARITTGSSNTILGRFNGNSSNCDIRESDFNLVLADGSQPQIVVNNQTNISAFRLGRGGVSSVFGTEAGQFDVQNNIEGQENVRQQFFLANGTGTFRFIARNGQQSTNITNQAGNNFAFNSNIISNELGAGDGLLITKSDPNNSEAVLTLSKHKDSTGNFIFCVKGNYTDSTATAVPFRVDINGNIINNTFNVGSGSDIKLKENVVDASPKLDKLMDVRFVNFNLKGSELKQFGVIAQELEEVFPGLVGETKDTESVEVTKTKTEREYLSDEEGNPVYDDEGNHKFEEKEVEYTETEERETGEVTKYVKYSILSLMAVKALQEANDKIIALEERLSALEAK